MNEQTHLNILLNFALYCFFKMYKFITEYHQSYLSDKISIIISALAPLRYFHTPQ